MKTDKVKIETNLDILRDLINKSNDAIFVNDPRTGLFIFVNDRACASLGYDREELLKIGVMDIETSFPDTSLWQSHVNELRQRSGLILEGIHKRKDGTTFPVEANISYVELNTREYMVAVVRDITERRRTEEEKDRLARAVSVVSEGIAVTDEQDRYIYVNDAHARTYGYLQSELMGKTWRDITPHEFVSLVEREVARTLHNRDCGVWSGECPGLCKDGMVISTEVTATARWSEKGEYLGHICVVKDISERKRMDEALRKSEEEYRMVVNNINEIIYRVSFRDDPLRGQVAFLSGPTEKILGFTCTEFMDNSELWVSLIHPDDTPALFEATKKMLDGRRPAVREFRIRRKHEPEYVWFEDKVFPQFNEKGDVIGYFGVARDISERKTAEEDKARLEEQLLQAQKMEAVGRLAGGIAHDFNNMLTAIIGYASLMERRLGTESPFRHYVDQILNSAQQSANLTSQLLAFSRKQIISPKETDLNELIRGMEILLKRLIGEDIECKTDLTDMHVTAMVDRGQIEQVLLNLCTNARDAMPRGGVLSISTDVLELDDGSRRTYDLNSSGRYAVITVTDTGKGLDEVTIQKIFEPFFTTKEIGKGTGLGLSIVYGIVKQHNGNITMQSEPGKGTTFKIFLPLIASPTGTARKERVVTPRGGTETILVAEDDEAVRILTSHILREAGYAVIEAVDGDDAIMKFRENKETIKLAICDVVMPKRSGKEVSDTIRTIKSDIRVLLASGYTADIISAKGIGEEGLDFISKPITPSNLLGKVREVLDN
ncbi:MAG TPA: PAS domain S-box protein [Thermodesulfovibrionales bacterium]|nr:PAS domain S-box protein [Thermodesulfovibrionales bacterium]